MGREKKNDLKRDPSVTFTSGSEKKCGAFSKNKGLSDRGQKKQGGEGASPVLKEVSNNIKNTNDEKRRRLEQAGCCERNGKEQEECWKVMAPRANSSRKLSGTGVEGSLGGNRRDKEGGKGIETG